MPHEEGYRGICRKCEALRVFPRQPDYPGWNQEGEGSIGRKREHEGVMARVNQW